MDRVYAVRGRDKKSFAILSSMTIVQFVYGVVYVAVSKQNGEGSFVIGVPYEVYFRNVPPGASRHRYSVGVFGTISGIRFVLPFVMTMRRPDDAVLQM